MRQLRRRRHCAPTLAALASWYNLSPATTWIFCIIYMYKFISFLSEYENLRTLRGRKLQLADIWVRKGDWGEYLDVRKRKMGRDSSVGIATRYVLDDPVTESRWGRDFPQTYRPALGSTPASYTMGTWSFPEVKRPRRGVDNPHPSIAEVTERVDLYFYSTSKPS
jgi:hypothetical protein